VRLLPKELHKMSWRAWNKTFVISIALAAAGLLTCAAGLLDALLPGASYLGSIAWMAAAAILATGIAVGYTWICEKFETWISERFDGICETRRQPPRKAGSPRPVPKAAPSVRSAPPRLPVSCEQYRFTLRGDALSVRNGIAKTSPRWHGQ
jgi:hypothetical protein